MGFETGTYGFRTPDTIHIFHRNKESVVYSYEIRLLRSVLRR